MYAAKGFESHHDLIKWINENNIRRANIVSITQSEESVCWKYTLF